MAGVAESVRRLVLVPALQRGEQERPPGRSTRWKRALHVPVKRHSPAPAYNDTSKIGKLSRSSVFSPERISRRIADRQVNADMAVWERSRTALVAPQN